MKKIADIKQESREASSGKDLLEDVKTSGKAEYNILNIFGKPDATRSMRCYLRDKTYETYINC
ncbi:MAG: hypothetical protein NZ529_04600 [Cytophagaceae bacterium]|nr:hypothetical protein [Cytophagaceae bacterium]MDW8456055.1 hypothetical protein [Cytophagaceae bacterium]